MLARLFVGALVVLGAVGCGGGEGSAGASCGEVGQVTELTDGSGDVRPNIAAPPPPPAPPGLDLERVALARSESEICAEWAVEDGVVPGTVFSVLLREAGGGDSGALVKVSARLLPVGRSTVQLSYPGVADGFVDGDVAVDGNRVSLRLKRSELPPFAPVDNLEWEAHTLGVGQRRGLQYTDCAPDDGHNIAYPGGQIVQVENAGAC